MLCSNINLLIFLQIEEMVQRTLNIYTKKKTDSNPKEKGNVHILVCFVNCTFLLLHYISFNLLGLASPLCIKSVV